MASFGSTRNHPIVYCRNERVGIWSQSKIATNSPVVLLSAALILPALAWLLSGRVKHCTPTSLAKAANSGRRPSSRITIFNLSRGQSIPSAASTVGFTTARSSLYEGMKRSTVGHVDVSSGKMTGLRFSGQAVCRYPSNKTIHA